MDTLLPPIDELEDEAEETQPLNKKTFNGSEKENGQQKVDSLKTMYQIKRTKGKVKDLERNPEIRS